MIKFLDLSAQYQTIKKDIDQAIQNVIQESAFIGGRHVAQFENEFAGYVDAGYCIGVGNGTDALEIAIEALDLPPGSEIIIPANSFIASSESVTRCGYKPVFCDINETDYTLDINDVKSRITDKTSAVIAVHLYGHPCDMDPLLDLAREHGLRIIEDCAQAHGAEYKGRRIGAIGDIGAFSFYPGKNLGAYGDAGAIVTNNEALALRCRMIANHGRKEKYDHLFEGRNSRLDGLQAAVLSVKLKHLDDWIAIRRKCADVYRKYLTGVDELHLPAEQPWSRHAYHLFVIRTKERDALRDLLRNGAVETGIHYPVALPGLEAYRNHFQHNESMRATRYSETLLSLPIGEHLSSDDVTYVSEWVIKFFQQ